MVANDKNQGSLQRFKREYQYFLTLGERVYSNSVIVGPHLIRFEGELPGEVRKMHFLNLFEFSLDNCV